MVFSFAEQLGEKIAITYFLLQVVKKKKMLTLLVSALCPANCADT